MEIVESPKRKRGRQTISEWKAFLDRVPKGKAGRVTDIPLTTLINAVKRCVKSGELELGEFAIGSHTEKGKKVVYVIRKPYDIEVNVDDVVEL